MKNALKIFFVNYYFLLYFNNFYLIQIRRLNIDHYIEDHIKKKCYTEWVKVRKCSDKFLGEQFTTYMDVTREINFAQKMQADRETKEYYDKLHKYKLELFGPDHLVPLGEEGDVEGGEAIEEAEAVEE